MVDSFTHLLHLKIRKKILRASPYGLARLWSIFVHAHFHCHRSSQLFAFWCIHPSVFFFTYPVQGCGKLEPSSKSIVKSESIFFNAFFMVPLDNLLLKHVSFIWYEEYVFCQPFQSVNLNSSVGLGEEITNCMWQFDWTIMTFHLLHGYPKIRPKWRSKY